jgi:hypothetical protein
MVRSCVLSKPRTPRNSFSFLLARRHIQMEISYATCALCELRKNAQATSLGPSSKCVQGQGRQQGRA